PAARARRGLGHYKSGAGSGQSGFCDCACARVALPWGAPLAIRRRQVLLAALVRTEVERLPLPVDPHRKPRVEIHSADRIPHHRRDSLRALRTRDPEDAAKDRAQNAADEVEHRENEQQACQEAEHPYRSPVLSWLSRASTSARWGKLGWARSSVSQAAIAPC